MNPRNLLCASWIAAAIVFGAPAAALAHGPDTSPERGEHMGPMMGFGMMGNDTGSGTMGPGYGTGQGMMGPGYGMGPGMMGSGYGMGPGMMGSAYGMYPGIMGRAYGMGPWAMYRGYSLGMQPLRRDLSADDVRHIMQHRLQWGGNPHIKVGKVEEKDDDTIIAEIVTQDGSLVDKLAVNRHTGMMQPVR